MTFPPPVLEEGRARRRACPWCVASVVLAVAILVVAVFR